MYVKIVLFSPAGSLEACKTNGKENYCNTHFLSLISYFFCFLFHFFFSLLCLHLLLPCCCCSLYSSSSYYYIYFRKVHVGDGGNVCLHLTLINDFTFTLYTFLFHFHIVLILVRNLAAEGDGKQELTVVLKYVK